MATMTSRRAPFVHISDGRTVNIRPPLAGDLLAMASLRRKQVSLISRFFALFRQSPPALTDQYAATVASMAMIQLLCTIDGKPLTMDEIKRLQAVEFNLICNTISSYL